MVKHIVFFFLQHIKSSHFLFTATEDIYLETPITDDLLRTTETICGVLSRPETNLLICGVSGSGRTEALHIAGTILHIKIASLSPVANYKLDDFYNDLRMVFIFLHRQILKY